MSIDEVAQAKLREKFDTAVIGLKPKITCKPCSDTKFTRCCDKHEKRQCNGVRGDDRSCGQWITTAHMHIEFVGHADVTDRLLQVDPEWTWEPFAVDEQTGLPKLTPDGGLWIRLTVLGVTRVGYGGADGKSGDDGVKEAVSDALKVTAMRFGVALDLWRKSEVSGKAAEDDGTIGRGEAPQRQNGDQRNGQRQQPKQDGPHPNELRQTIKGIAKAKGTTYERLAGLYLEGTSRDLDHEQDSARLQQFIDAIHDGRVQIPAGEPAGASS